MAGYPETHIESKSKQEDLKYLKMKIEAGADLIITQLFYDVEMYLKYIKDCREFGIKCPIIPGILPIQNYNSFKRIIHLCNSKCPKELEENLEKLKNDDEKVKELGIDYCTKMCMQMIEKGILGLHFYTLNLEKSVCEVLRRLELSSSPKPKELPWKKLNTPKRTSENVRPIFWKNNTKSYLSKTWYWDEFPNGIWGDSRSPAFGNVEDHFLSICKDYYKDSKRTKHYKKIWGDKITSLEDISQVFINFIEGKIKKIPWCEETEIENEIILIKDILLEFNSKFIFTINSQPTANCKPSNDPYVGWGPNNGYIFQRFYIEFFIDPHKLYKLIDYLKQSPLISYQAINKNGEVITNINRQSVIALTWGVFPNREIIQPTIYDSEVFLIWKEEAFNLWNDWIKIYDDEENENDLISVEILKKVQSDFYLMTIVDNDFINPKSIDLLFDYLKSL